MRLKINAVCSEVSIFRNDCHPATNEQRLEENGSSRPGRILGPLDLSQRQAVNKLINRPGVAGAVLQTASSLIE